MTGTVCPVNERRQWINGRQGAKGLRTCPAAGGHCAAGCIGAGVSSIMHAGGYCVTVFAMSVWVLPA